MSANAARIRHEALQLSERDRADLAADLLASLTPAANDEGVEMAWAAEIERHARRVLAGESKGMDWSQARDRIASSLRK
ncbi:MAG TPA: addiction module protein [Thermoanaerobaculia bacterium]|nr:addiction module protein [Thermoanaerobaculia bacterium]